MRKRRLSLQQIVKALLQHKKELKKLTVKKIGIFGSYVKGSQDKDSDIDFIVELEDYTLDNYMRLVDFLERLFNRKVDVLTPLALKTIRVKKVAEEIKRNLIYV